MKTITQSMIERDVIEHTKMLQALLDNPAFKLTNHGYEIDILCLVSQLSKSDKKLVVKFLLT